VLRQHLPGRRHGRAHLGVLHRDVFAVAPIIGSFKVTPYAVAASADAATPSTTSVTFTWSYSNVPTVPVTCSIQDDDAPQNTYCAGAAAVLHSQSQRLDAGDGLTYTLSCFNTADAGSPAQAPSSSAPGRP